MRALPSALVHEPLTDRRRLVGIALMCGALAFFACGDASSKALSRAGVDPLLTTFMRYFVSVAMISAFLNPVRTPGAMHTRRPGLQAVRSLLLFGTTALNYLALRHLQLADALAIQFAAPLTVALLAGPLLGEWSSRHRLFAIAVGFLGVLVIVRPDTGALHPAVLFSLGNMFCYALYIVITRKLAAFDSTATTMVYSGLAGLALTAPLLPWIWTTPTVAWAWILLIGIGLCGTVGHWLLILAHARAPANVLAPFLYTQLRWVLLLGFFVFGDVPSLWTMLGAAIIVGSGLYLLAHDAVARRKRPAPAREPA